MEQRTVQEIEEELEELERPSRLELARQWVMRNRIPTAIAAAALLVPLLLSGYLLYAASQERVRHDDLQNQISRLSAIAGITPQRQEEVLLEFARIQDAVPLATLRETDVYTILLDLAEERGLDMQMTYRGESQRKVGNTNYRVLRFSVTMDGPYDGVWGLLTELDGPAEELPTLVLENISLTVAASSRGSADFTIYTQTP